MGTGIEERIGRLERTNRRLAGVVALLGVALGGALVAGATAPPPGTVRAEKFVLVDARGKTRGLWYVSPADDVILGLRGKKAVEGLSPMLAATEGGDQFIKMLDGDRRAGMAIFEGTPRLALESESGSAEVVAHPRRGPGLKVHDAARDTDLAIPAARR